MAQKRKISTRKSAKRATKKNTPKPKSKTLTKAQKAEKMVEGFWTTYDAINRFLGKLLQISEKKLMAMQAADEIDLNKMIKASINDSGVTVAEFYAQLNAEIQKAFEPDPKLKEMLSKPLYREAKKIVITDKNTISSELLKDAVSKGVQVFALTAAVEDFTKMMKEEHSARKEKAKEAEEKKENVG